MPILGLPAAAIKGVSKVSDARQMLLPLQESSPTIRAFTGQTEEILGRYNMERARKGADMGPALYVTENTAYASKEAEKRVGKGVPTEKSAPAVYPLDLYPDQIMMLDRQYPREIGEKLQLMNTKVQLPKKGELTGEDLIEQIRANFKKEQFPYVFKALGFKGSEFTPGGVPLGTGRSFAIYETLDTAKGAYTKRAFANGGEVLSFIKNSGKRR
jgi:hypothetical protein